VISEGVVKAAMLPISSTATVEAVEANIEPGGVVLIGKSTWCGGAYKPALTIESKHWVQSSRYTAWFGPGGRSSVKL
jgi:hypothetical protein